MTQAIVNETRKKYVIAQVAKNKLATIGLIIVTLMGIVAIFAPLIATHPPNEMIVGKSFLPMNTEGHLLGTDNYGRDLFSRLVYGTRISMIVGIAAVLFGAVFGTLLGLVAGYFGGRIDSIIMRTMDGLFAFPFILLAITLMTVLGQGLVNVIVAIGIANIPGFARLVRGQVLSVKRKNSLK